MYYLWLNSHVLSKQFIFTEKWHRFVRGVCKNETKISYNLSVQHTTTVNILMYILSFWKSYFYALHILLCSHNFICSIFPHYVLCNVIMYGYILSVVRLLCDSVGQSMVGRSNFFPIFWYVYNSKQMLALLRDTTVFLLFIWLPPHKLQSRHNQCFRNKELEFKEGKELPQGQSRVSLSLSQPAPRSGPGCAWLSARHAECPVFPSTITYDGRVFLQAPLFDISIPLSLLSHSHGYPSPLVKFKPFQLNTPQLKVPRQLGQCDWWFPTAGPSVLALLPSQLLLDGRAARLITSSRRKTESCCAH